MWASEAFSRFQAALKCYPVWEQVRVLDIGSGSGEHSSIMSDAGFNVHAFDFESGSRFEDRCWSRSYYDAVWCSHVLEHALDVNTFLRLVYFTLKNDGLLSITVPPAKHEIVGGHVSLWNAGLLIYRLVLAGFDCSEAQIGTYGYNISVIVRKVRADLPKLKYDSGDVQALLPFFPCPFQEGMSGVLPDIRW